MQKDPQTPNQFNCLPSEKIEFNTTVDKPPFLAQFPFNPVGGTWLSTAPDPAHLRDTRIFQCPQNAGDSLSFAVSFNEAIAAGDPNPVAIYTLKFISLSDPASQLITLFVPVPQGAGPILNQYTFVVVKP